MPTGSFQLESDHSVQRIGGDYTQFDGRSFTAVEVQQYAFHKLRQSNTKLSEDDDLCVIAALDPEYRFPNQTARRHIYSVWNHKFNAEFADKEKPRGLYQAQNKPTWFPKDVRYLSATNARKGEPKLSAEELSRVLPIIRDNLVEFLKQEMLQNDLSRVPELPNDVVENLQNQVGKPNFSLGKTQVFKIEPEFTTSDASVTLCVNFGESKPTFDGIMYVDVVEPIADQGHALQYTATLQMPQNSTNSSTMQETYVDPSPLGPIPTVVECMEPEEAAMEESIPAETKLDFIPAFTPEEISDLLSSTDVVDILANQCPGIFQVRPVLDEPVLKDEKPLTVMWSGNPTMKIEKPPSANNLYIEGVDDWWASPVARDKYTPSFCSAPTVDDGAFPVLPHTNEVVLIIEPHQVSYLDQYLEIGDVEILQDVDFNAMNDLLAGDDPISMIIDEMDERDRLSSL